MTDIQILHNRIDANNTEWLSVAAIADGQLVASCDVVGWSDPCPKLNGLAVHPENRRKGIGAQTVAALLNKCREAGKQSLTLTVRPKNEAAISLYRKLGFKTFYKGSGENDEFWMSVPLNQ